MDKIQKYLNYIQGDILQEGLGSILMCKKAKLGIKLNRRDYLEPAQQGLKSCKQFKETSWNRL